METRTNAELRQELHDLLNAGNSQVEVRRIMNIGIHKFYKLYRTEEESARIQNYRK